MPQEVENILFKCPACGGDHFFLADNRQIKTVDVVCVNCLVCFATFTITESFREKIKDVGMEVRLYKKSQQKEGVKS